MQKTGFYFIMVQLFFIFMVIIDGRGDIFYDIFTSQRWQQYVSRKTKAFRFFQRGYMMILLQISNSFGTMQNEGTGGLCDAAQVIIAIVPLVSVVILGMLTYFFMLWDHQKRLIIIQKGGTPSPRHIDEKLLLLGIVALFIGIGLTVFFAIYNGLNPSLLGGIIPTTSGLGIITYYGIIKRKRD